MLPFIFDTSKGETPQSIAMKRELAARIMGQGRRTPQNVGEGWGSVLASIGDGISANVLNRRAGAAEAAGQAGASDMRNQFINMMTGGQSFPEAPSSSFEQNATPLDPASARVAQAHGDGGGGMTAYQNAIASIESAGSGDYGAIGPTHSTLGRALGRYQVMEANIGPWSEKYLGKRITPEEFLQNPQYQDALFNGEFGSYVDKYGPEGAAQAWFGGEGGVGKVNRKDSLGTTIGAYTDKFRSALGGTPPAVAANEAMATGGMPSGLTPEMLQQWGAANYADPAAIQAEMRASQPPPVPQDMAPPMPPPRTIQDMPVAEPQPVQMAQAGGMDLSQIPAMAGGNAGVLQPGQQVPPDIGMLMQVVSHPFMDEGTKAFALAQLQQHMQAQDPMRQMQLEKGRLEIDALRNPQPELTSAIREYEYARGQGFDGSFEQFQQAQRRAGATNVNVGGDGAPGLGKLSADFGYRLDPETRQPVIDPETGLPQAAPIPGSPAARQIEEEEAARAAGQRNASDYARTVTQDVGIADSYLSEIDGIYASDGIVGANLRAQRAGLRGTPEYNMKTFMDSALSNVTLDTMNRMRETSAAGATGMGNMSDKQLKVIQGVLGQWDPALPIEDQRLILHRLGNFYMDVQFGTKAEREEAVRDGRMTPEENAAIQELYNPETRDLRGRRLDEGSGDVPAGWEDDWEYLTPEERQQILQQGR